MAEEEKNEERTQEGSEQKTEEKTSRPGLMTWLLTAGIILGCAVGGFALSQLLVSSGPKEAVAQKIEEKPADFFESQENTDGEPWQYDLKAVIGNLDEPGVTRYLRVSVTLIMSQEMDRIKGNEFLDGVEEESAGKKDILIDYLSDYISGLTLEKVRGQKNRRRIKKEITEGFNELLFPDSKPYVNAVLLKEFAVQ